MHAICLHFKELTLPVKEKLDPGQRHRIRHLEVRPGGAVGGDEVIADAIPPLLEAIVEAGARRRQRIA